MLKNNITRAGGTGAREARPKAKRDYGAGAAEGKKRDAFRQAGRRPRA